MNQIKALLSLIFFGLLIGQIGAQESEIKYVDDSFSTEGSPEELQLIENALLKCDMKPEFLDDLIAEEFDSIQFYLNYLKKIVVDNNLRGKIISNGLSGWSMLGSHGIIFFRSANGNKEKSLYTIDYWYKEVRNGGFKIKVLSIKEGRKTLAEFPELYKVTDEQYWRINEVLKGSDNKAKINLLSSFLENSKKSRKHGVFPHMLMDDDFALIHGNLAWCYLLEGNGEEALIHARKGLELPRIIDKQKVEWINVNLILSYLSIGETEKGLKLYEASKEILVGEKSVQDVLLSDIKTLKKHGVKIPKMKKINRVISLQ